MHQNNSPWLYQLHRTREVDIIVTDMNTQIVIVGGGISGVMTAYFLLKNTHKQVTLIEGNKVAHGATGHNAGQLVAEFERPFTDIVREYGLEKANDAEESVNSAWILLEEIFKDAKIETPVSTFVGYNGYKYKDHIIDQLKAVSLRKYGERNISPLFIASEWIENNPLPQEFDGLYEVVPQANILSLLETEDSDYVAATSLKKGCTNSALLTEELAGYLLSQYKGRFTLLEHSSVAMVTLGQGDINLSVVTNRKDGNPEDTYTVHCEKVILCTNGFERIQIKNNAGDDIDAKFHHMVNGDIGYMAAYTEELKNPPTALGYYDQGEEMQGVNVNAYTDTPYVYKTRRPYEIEKNEIHNLVCFGGPEQQIEETQDYDRYAPFVEEKGDIIKAFIKKTVIDKKDSHLEYRFKWHGIMCYTPTNLRVIGEEPKNPLLLYNLGCNGVGILPAIFGAHKISRIINGEKFEESVFDPKK